LGHDRLWHSGSAAGRGQFQKGLTERALAGPPTTEPRPSEEEVESVFRAVIASYAEA
jgi:hypothetical protein